MATANSDADADAVARERLARAVPPRVREVCTTIAAAGHQAVIVGGCVRDVLMGRVPGDWDVASSAHPEDVMKLFKRTVPQGLQHGTVKVLMGKGKENEVEVTTFRGESAYSDARRPDSVTFGVPLVEDLARRDLVVNAIAYDPARNQIIDPFGGRADIAARRLRAVGSAVDRFTEDGLRVMRAARFAAQLEFDLDPDTAAGIPPALPSLAKVSRERVCEELRKILKARQPSRGLRPALHAGILATVLTPLADVVGPWADATREQWLARIDAIDAGLVEVRLAALMVPLAQRVRHSDRAEGGGSGAGDAAVLAVDMTLAAEVGDILRALKFSNLEIETAAQLVGVAHFSRAQRWNDQLVRRGLSRIDKQRRELAVALWASESPPNAALVATARRVLDEAHPLGTGDLAIKGKDLMDALQLQPGPAIGRVLERLVDLVLDDPARNTREQLLAHAQLLELEVGR